MGLVDRIVNAFQLVEAPAPRPYEVTLLSRLEALGLLMDAPFGSHLQNGVGWESDAAAEVVSNSTVVYEEGEFTSEDKTEDVQIAYATGFAFEIARFITLGIGSGGGEEESLNRAMRRGVGACVQPRGDDHEDQGNDDA